MKTHRFDAISFVAGAVMTLLGLLFLVPRTPVEVIHVLTGLGSWFWPAVLVVLGLAVLFPVLLPGKTAKESELSPPRQ